MKSIVICALLIFLANGVGLAHGQAPEPVAGKDYIEIPNGSPLDPADGKIVVEEFFSYICPACSAFEPQFAAWAAKLPDDVKVVRIPATFRADFMQYARAYYAAQILGIAEKTHTAVYRAIHFAHTLPAEGDKPDEEKIAAFYADNYGVSEKDFLNTMRSFGVDAKIRRATAYMQKCKIPGTPSIVVNGRYVVRGQSYDDLLRIASYLIDKER
jgi:protein dithiol oxidoreductase (disulfide-forming)